MKPKEIVFICQVFHPDKGSTSQLFSPLMKELAKDGHNIRVLTGVTEKHLLREQKWGNVVIRRCGLYAEHKKNYILRALAYLSFILGVFWYLIRNARSTDIWFAVTNPPFNAWIVYAASKITRSNVKTIYMFLDLHPEGLIALNKLRQTNIMVQIWKKINYVAYRSIDHLIVLGRDMVPIIQRNYGIPESKLRYIPHWSIVSPKKLQFAKHVSILGAEVREDTIIVQYSGNMGLWHDIEIFVKAAKALRDENVVFHFIGGGIRKHKAQKVALELECDNIIWSDFVPVEDLEESLQACHIALISLRKGLEGVAVPCKLYGILASGRAIVAQVPRNSEVALTIEENNCGIVVEPGDEKELVTAIQNLALDRQLMSDMGSRSYAAFQRSYRFENALVEFRKVFSGI